MKTVIMMCHTQPQRDDSLPKELWGLSVEGVMAANRLFKSGAFDSVSQVWASTCRSAYETAMVFTDGVTLDSHLDADNPKEKVCSFVGEVMRGLKDGEAALAVSHAETIRAYLGSDAEMASPSAFVLSFEGDEIADIRYIE